MYAEDLEFCTQIITALSYIVRVCQERQVEYPDLKNEIKGLIEGVRVRLPSGEIVTREDGSPFHGLLEQINDFQRVADILIEEVELNVTERQALIDTGGESNGCEEEGQEPL